MTVRELINTKMRRARWASYGFLLLFVPALFWPRGSSYDLFLLVPFIGSAASILYVFYFVRCPKCGAQLGYVVSSLKKVDFCPTCGGHFDERA